MTRRTVFLFCAAIGVALPSVASAQRDTIVRPRPPVPTAPTPTPTTSPTPRTAAQDAAEARLGRPVSNQQIIDAIRRSGLSQQEIKARLQASGYSANLADPFFGTDPTVTPTATSVQSASFVEALQALGLMALPVGEEEVVPTEAENVERAAREAAPYRTGGIFGRELFGKTSGIFEPTAVGPVDQSYRLGPGDQVQVVFTGGVEQAYALEVRKDGTLVVPQVGQFGVAGLTLESARALFTRQAARSFSGLNSGRVNVDLTVSRVRSNQVFVIGEVESPGAIQVSGLATAFHAIARAGGPNVRGSFRNIEVRRGGVVIKRLDLYDYLANGDVSTDIRTEQGDVIYVPLNVRGVVLTGAVRRPATFELTGDEGFSDLLRFSGGLLATAATDRVQIDRILPPEQRGPGRDRVVIDVILNGSMDSLARVKLFDGDEVKVFSVSALRRGSLTLAGEVFNPGTFELSPNLTLGQLIDRAQGTRPWAARDRVKIIRTRKEDGKTELLSVDLNKPEVEALALQEFDDVRVLDSRVADNGPLSVEGAVRKPFSNRAARNTTLKDAIDLAGGFYEYAMTDRVKVQRVIPQTGRSELISVDFASADGPGFELVSGDRVIVLDGRSTVPSGTVSVEGEVVSPGSHSYVERQTIQDIIDQSGGFRETAADVEVARRRVNAEFNDTTSVIFRFGVQDRVLDADGRSFVLERSDRVLVRALPGYRQQRFAEASGMFKYPASYAIAENQDRITDLVARAGGLLPGAYLRSGRLLRSGRIVAIDLERAMKGDPANNIKLVSGDLLTLAADPGTVYVSGSVQRPALIRYDRSLSLDDYLNRAGGTSPRANAGAITVEDPSGLVRRRTRSGLFFHSDPRIVSGSTIFVPEKPEDSNNGFRETLTVAVQTATALASLAIAFLALSK